MICYICHRHTTNSFSHKKINFGYCNDHLDEIQKGVAKFIITGNTDYINERKKEFYYKDNQLNIYVEEKESDEEIN